ncbi:MAG: twin-arginine translocase TatA/TatE family subunit [Terracidiphilus sp.]
MADSLILMVLALVVFGPRRLPQIGRQIGKLMYEFRKASNDFKFQMEEELRLSEEADRRKKEEEQRKQLAVTQVTQESVSVTPALVKAMQSPYPAEETSTSTASPQSSTADNIEPRILPPSTGETVAAQHRSEPTELNEQPAETQPATPPAAEGPSAPETPQATTPEPASAHPAGNQQTSPSEAVNHNG